MAQDGIYRAIQLAEQNRLAGRLAEAEAVCRQALAQKLDHPDALHLLGVTIAQAGRLDEAIAVIGRAIAINPNAAIYHNDLGTTLRNRGRLEQAVASYRRAIKLAPELAMGYSNLGAALNEMGLIEEAVVEFQRCLKIRPDVAEVQNNLGHALWEIGRLDEAIAACRQAARLKPEYADPRINIGNSLKDMGLIEEAIEAYRLGITRQPNSATYHGNLLLAMHYHEKFEAQQLLAESIRWAGRHADRFGKNIAPHLNERSPERRLKVGYVSPDYRGHPVGRFFLPLLANHDAAQVEVFCYAQLGIPDGITRRIHKLAHQWRNIVGLSDEQVAEMVRRDQIDVLVDLAGHTARNRLLVFARKPAPIQVTWLGYPSTTGMATIDYRLTDGLADPEGVTDTYCCERLVRLPHSAWCFEGPEESPLPAATPGEGRPITFCSFNDFSKVNQPMLETWAKILLAVPGSRLLIKAKAIGCAEVQARVGRIMSVAGVSQDRLELQGRRKSFTEHLAAYHETDIALDTFPYHGTTTTCEAMWMGVPVVTLAGKAHVSRVGVSLLTSVGLTELIANSAEEYAQIAVALAKDLKRLGEIKAVLRERMVGSALMDAPRFSRDMEAAYRQMWRTWCQTAP